MEQKVNGIYERFFVDLIENYACEREESFLYRAYWTEEVKRLFRWLLRTEKEKKEKDGAKDAGSSVDALLREQFSWLSPEEIRTPEAAARFEAGLETVLRDGPAWMRELLLIKGTHAKDKKRRDLWRELHLNNAGCRAGLIGPAEYYLWLAEYLAENDSYYKNVVMSCDMTACLCAMLEEGLRDTEWAPSPGWEQKKKAKDDREISVSVGEQIQEKLSQLAELLKKEKAEGKEAAVGRFQKRNCCRGCEHCLEEEAMESWSHLWCLTAQLKKRALHDTIKNWLGDSGHSVDAHGRQMLMKKQNQKETDGEEAQKKAGKVRSAKMAWEKRKQDFTMQLFAGFCDSEDGYRFDKKSEGGGAHYKNWRLTGKGFCELDVSEEQLDGFTSVWQNQWNDFLYIPLAVHLPSGCVFFLSGKSNYDKLYRAELGKAARELKAATGEKKQRKIEEKKKRLDELTRSYAAYRNDKEHKYCYDYLVLDKERWANMMGEGERSETQGVGIPLRPAPVFHKRAGTPYKTVWNEFKTYCIESNFNEWNHAEDSPFDALRTINAEWPEDAPSISDALKGFFMDDSRVLDDAASDELDREVAEERKAERAASREAKAAFFQSMEKKLDNIGL